VPKIANRYYRELNGSGVKGELDWGDSVKPVFLAKRHFGWYSIGEVKS
jgi:hypothetical protein